ncbi:hypothetical protein J6590_012010 [Homalodisca vitripennis]|nr:hypothetical protein J6590_012010 [Homalodisca vitripennis]
MSCGWEDGWPGLRLIKQKTMASTAPPDHEAGSPPSRAGRYHLQPSSLLGSDWQQVYHYLHQHYNTSKALALPPSTLEVSQRHYHYLHQHYNKSKALALPHQHYKKVRGTIITSINTTSTSKALALPPSTLQLGAVRPRRPDGRGVAPDPYKPARNVGLRQPDEGHRSPSYDFTVPDETTDVSIRRLQSRQTIVET